MENISVEQAGAVGVLLLFILREIKGFVQWLVQAIRADQTADRRRKCDNDIADIKKSITKILRKMGDSDD
ncbi:MAG: hypothetical protein GWM98_15465 [Nitrospinaceae bacterium]|nr:hypothetical protein [Nitrospinaceae bacterium]NIR55623.1 hypothetical protein [Nitrospinaceae bacterium]NIS86057.1 hypothetical protein [Nitrospinaceae bacterium]NIT82900.1 hypothetical protein [Nitrospinaceae bacterium]NIU45105.1 hypothetical protein [Nitrospinaceae bacterium]